MSLRNSTSSACADVAPMVKDTRFERLGLATELLCRIRPGQKYGLEFIWQRLQPAIILNQICFGFEERCRVVAFWTWAFLAPDVEERLVRDPSTILHFSEWNEGPNLWVLDLVAPFGHLIDVIRFLQRGFFAGHTSASTARITGGGVVKVSKWYAGSRDDPRGTVRGNTARKFVLPDSAFAPSIREIHDTGYLSLPAEVARWMSDRRGGCIPKAGPGIWESADSIVGQETPFQGENVLLMTKRV
jgi:cytolysin-activating lysine-acyltransferase